VKRREILGLVGAFLTSSTGCLRSDGASEGNTGFVEARYETEQYPYLPETAARFPPYAVVQLYHKGGNMRIEGYVEGTDCQSLHLEDVSYDDKEQAYVFDIIKFDVEEDCVGTDVSIWYEIVAGFKESNPPVVINVDDEKIPHCTHRRPSIRPRCRKV